MKHNLNVIQIRGIRGIIIAGFVVCCLTAGFIVFPGWLCMHIWNFISSHVYALPVIGLLQGVLLWGILVAAYFAFKKDKFIICVKTPQGLSEDELKDVLTNVKKQSEEDQFFQAMLKAREIELSKKNTNTTEIDSKTEDTQTTESNKI